MRPEIEYVYNKLKKLRFDLKLSDFNDFSNCYRYDPELMRYVRKDDNDLFIDKNTFKPLEEELEYADSCHKVEEEIGCPLEVVITPYFKRGKLEVFYRGKMREVIRVVAFEQATRPYMDVFYRDNEKEQFKVKTIWLDDYKKTWWLKKDKSE